MRVVCVLVNNKDRLEEFAEACFRFTPQIALGDGAVFLEIEACRRLYTEQSVVLRLQALLKRFEMNGRIAISHDLPTAISLAKFRVSDRSNLPIETLPYYFSPFNPPSDMNSVVLSLKRLGIQTLSEFGNLPRKSIVTKLGKEALYALMQMEGAQKIIWPWYIAKEKVREHEHIDDSYRVRELEPILFLLKRILDRTLLRLRGKGHLANEFRLTFHQEPYSFVKDKKREWVFNLSMPQGSVHGLLPILRERLDRDLQKKPLESEVVKIEIEILRSAPGQIHQVDFFCKKEQEEESFRAVVARFTEKLGHNKVFYAEAKEHYFPERSWSKTLLEPKVLECKIPERPLRTLKIPKRLSRIENWLIHKTKKWQILSMEGPERLSGDWWDKDKERDYFRVQTSSGEELWVFSHPDTQELFLHGIFD